MAKGKNRANKVHDGLVRHLDNYLYHSMDYEKVWKFWEYCRNGYVGEVDLLAFADDIYDFYEVKCNYTPRAEKKAQEQYERFQLAFPKWRTNGFLYTSDLKLRRLGE